jgi:hypothetical protein
LRIFSEFFPKNIRADQDKQEVGVICPFHDDESPSASINLDKGVFYCQVCKEPGIDEIEFVRRMLEAEEGKIVSFSEAREHADKLAGGIKRDDAQRKRDFQGSTEKDGKSKHKKLDANDIKKSHTMLLNNKKALDFLHEKRGFNDDIIEKFQLGFELGTSTKPNRVSIPIFSPDGELLNFRRYAIEHVKDAKDKMISVLGHGSLYLFPLENIKSQEILIFEGEMDTILACQHGFYAMTVTGGAGNWADWMTPMFQDKDVAICYDIDTTGKRGAMTVAKRLLSTCNSVKILNIPVRNIGNGDYTDWIVKQGGTPDDLKAIIHDTKPLTKVDDDHEGYLDVHLSEATKSQYFNKNIQVCVIVAGKHTAPFNVAKKIRVTCLADKKNCFSCGLSSGCEEFVLKSTDRYILKLIDCSDKVKKGVVKEIAGITQFCSSFEFEELEVHNVEEVQLMPELDFLSDNSEHVIRRAYVIGHEVKANTSYKMSGVTTSNPANQESTHLFEKVEPTQDSISTFKMTPELYKKLSIFQGEPDIKWKSIVNDLSNNVTQIFGREDLHIGTDLVYHSVLSFIFQDKVEKRGWVECLFLGDTRTGKSEVVQGIVNHYKLGEFCTGENSTFAGLVGGAQQLGKERWIITWGKIPLNDRRLVVIDEASGLDQRAIEIMSGIRSSGIAEQNKIKSEKTHARTRLLWISNDRQGIGLGAYGYGLNAVLDLIGKTEDVARFEFVVTASSDEVPMSVINTKKQDRKTVKHIYTSDLCRSLVLWAWSRKAEDIVFTDEAVDSIFELSAKQGNFYTSRIPLVQGANQRMKLARLAVACAARLFSTDITGEKVIVESKHVVYVYNYLNDVYKKPSLGYSDLSLYEIESNKHAMLKHREIDKLLDQNPLLADVFLPNEVIHTKDIEDMLDLEHNEARAYIKTLAKFKMIEKNKHGGYRKSQAFIKILKSWKEGHINKLMEDML